MPLVVIQARMGSVRLPGKVLLPFRGKTILQYLIDNISMYSVDKSKIVLATSDQRQDDVLEVHASDLDVLCVRGSERNVFERFQKAALLSDEEDIVRLTGDNPLLSMEVLNYSIKKHLKNNVTLTSTRYVSQDGTVERCLPKGNGVDVFKAEILRNTDCSMLTDIEKEHVVPFFYKFDYQLVTLGDMVEEGVDEAFLRSRSITVDTEQDYQCLIAMEY